MTNQEQYDLIWEKAMKYDNLTEEITRQYMEHTERKLAEIITKYDFVVGSIECKHRLMEILPEGANIVCTPYIVDPTMIYAIKKFDISDLIESYQTESED